MAEEPKWTGPLRKEVTYSPSLIMSDAKES